MAFRSYRRTSYEQRAGWLRAAAADDQRVARRREQLKLGPTWSTRLTLAPGSYRAVADFQGRTRRFGGV